LIRIGILTDGKYGDRAYENISNVFPCTWIEIEEIPTNIILDDYELNIPEYDLYISYLRHPDQVLALAELGKPTILGISFGDGFMRQVKELNSRTFAYPTMCSIEPNTNISEIDEYAKNFGRPIYKSNVLGGKIAKLEVIRSSPCGSSLAGANFIKEKLITVEKLQNFAINVCYECRAPRFGRTCDKEIAGIIHLRALIKSILECSKVEDEKVLNFINKIENEYNEKLKKYGNEVLSF